jgi:hypothetical protein
VALVSTPVIRKTAIQVESMCERSRSFTTTKPATSITRLSKV